MFGARRLCALMGAMRPEEPPRKAAAAKIGRPTGAPLHKNRSDGRYDSNLCQVGDRQPFSLRTLSAYPNMEGRKRWSVPDI